MISPLICLFKWTCISYSSIVNSEILPSEHFSQEVLFSCFLLVSTLKVLFCDYAFIQPQEIEVVFRYALLPQLVSVLFLCWHKFVSILSLYACIHALFRVGLLLTEQNVLLHCFFTTGIRSNQLIYISQVCLIWKWSDCWF